MIITEQFVLLAFPKTGTTFTTAVLRNIHGNRRLLTRFLPYQAQKNFYRLTNLNRPGYQEHRIPRIDPVPTTGKQRTSRHGSYSDIPEHARHLKLASVVRNPMSRYTSAYLYSMRMRRNIRHLAEPDLLRQKYPRYPDISFEDYYDIMHEYERNQFFPGLKTKIELGAQTVHFVYFYFKNPREVIQKIDSDYIHSNAYKNDIAAVHFMRQENLRQEFKEFLKISGYRKKEYELVDTFGRQNVAQRSGNEKNPDSFYTPELKAKILSRDALLFKIFPEYIPDNIKTAVS